MGLPVLKVRDGNGNVYTIPAIVGPPGPKPVKGVDYWTEEDKAELSDYVAEAVTEAKQAASETQSIVDNFLASCVNVAEVGQ